MRTESRPKRDRYCVTDLTCDRCLASDKTVIVREALDARSLEMGDRPVLRRVKVATLLGLEELGSDGHRRLLPDQSTHHVAGTARVLSPTWSQQGVRQVKPGTSVGNGPEASLRQSGVLASDV